MLNSNEYCMMEPCYNTKTAKSRWFHQKYSIFSGENSFMLMGFLPERSLHSLSVLNSLKADVGFGWRVSTTKATMERFTGITGTYQPIVFHGLPSGGSSNLETKSITNAYSRIVLTRTICNRSLQRNICWNTRQATLYTNNQELRPVVTDIPCLATIFICSATQADTFIGDVEGAVRIGRSPNTEGHIRVLAKRNQPIAITDTRLLQKIPTSGSASNIAGRATTRCLPNHIASCTRQSHLSHQRRIALMAIRGFQKICTRCRILWRVACPNTNALFAIVNRATKLIRIAKRGMVKFETFGAAVAS